MVPESSDVYTVNVEEKYTNCIFTQSTFSLNKAAWIHSECLSGCECLTARGMLIFVVVLWSNTSEELLLL